MNTFTRIINQFVNEKGYRKNEQCEGVIYYGSRSYEMYNQDSDIDLQVVFSNDDKILMRGITTFQDYRIEYFEKSLGDYMVGY